MKCDFLATVNIGLEKIASKEITSILNTEVFQGIGSISFFHDLDATYILNIFSKTINKLILVIIRSYFENLQDIYKISKFPSYTDYIDESQSFAVRVERIGKHDFTSIEAAERIGKGIIDSYLEEKKIRLKVNLDHPDVEFFSRIIGNEIIIGINTTGISLHKRGYRIFNHPSALSPTIAASMVYISQLDEGEILVDPMCGGGTIPIEASLIKRKIPLFIFRERRNIRYAFESLKFFDKKRYEEIKCKAIEDIKENNCKFIASDLSKRFLNGAILNSVNASVSSDIDFFRADARNIDRTIKEVNKVILNPPYGKRSADYEYVKELYRDFLYALSKMNIDSAVIITAAPNILRKYIEANGFRIDEEIKTIHGGLMTKIFKIFKA